MAHANAALTRDTVYGWRGSSSTKAGRRSLGGVGSPVHRRARHESVPSGQALQWSSLTIILGYRSSADQCVGQVPQVGHQPSSLSRATWWIGELGVDGRPTDASRLNPATRRGRVLPCPPLRVGPLGGGMTAFSLREGTTASHLLSTGGLL
jgi:hypothetical protein